MIKLLKKFRASLALDEAGHQHKPGGAGHFETSLRELDRDLRDSPAGGKVPPGLHSGIMRAVNHAGTADDRVRPAWPWWRFATAMLVVAAGAGLFWSVNRQPASVALDLPAVETQPYLATAIKQSQELAQAAPKAVLDPLSVELERLNGDLEHAINFLAASVP